MLWMLVRPRCFLRTCSSVCYHAFYVAKLGATFLLSIRRCFCKHAPHSRQAFVACGHACDSSWPACCVSLRARIELLQACITADKHAFHLGKPACNACKRALTHVEGARTTGTIALWSFASVGVFFGKQSCRCQACVSCALVARKCEFVAKHAVSVGMHALVTGRHALVLVRSIHSDCSTHTLTVTTARDIVATTRSFPKQALCVGRHAYLLANHAVVVDRHALMCKQAFVDCCTACAWFLQACSDF